jgi:hypothetical protein
MANDPPFATLNHFTGDLGIPSESDSLRIGIILVICSVGAKVPLQGICLYQMTYYFG